MSRARDIADGQQNFVNVTGDTMTGQLVATGPYGIRHNGFGVISQYFDTANYDAIRFLNNAGTTEYARIGYDLISGSGAARVEALGADSQIQFITNSVGRMGIDSAGRVTMPYQPVASAGWTSNVNPGNVVPANTIRVNVGGHLSAAGRFTAPVAGVYFAAISGMASGSNDLRIQLNLNGSTAGPDYVSYSRSSDYSKGAWMGYINLAANDYLEFYITAGVYAALHDNHGHIAFHLVG